MIVTLFSDDPPCSAATCNEMRASEWQYLCAVHDPPKPCCAIDYCCHTLDWTNSVLTSQKNFPSRMALSGEGGGSGGHNSQLRQLTNIFRRVYRIFAHAWFQHRDMYWKVELKSGLYVFFKTVCDVYNLIPEDNYTVPPEAEGIEPPASTGNEHTRAPSILKREKDNSGMDHERTTDETNAHLKAPIADGSKTRKHRHTPSVGSESITTVLEDPEEDEEKEARMEETVILSSEPPEYESLPGVEGVGEAITAPGPVVEHLAPTEDAAVADVEEKEAATVDVPAISMEETAIPTAGDGATESHSEVAAEKEDVEETAVVKDAVVESKLEAEEASEAVASSAASDTSTTSTTSTDSWQVLTDEEQTSSDATPASSTAETEVEDAPEEAEAAVKKDTESTDAEDVDGGEKTDLKEDEEPAGVVTKSKEEESTEKEADVVEKATTTKETPAEASDTAKDETKEDKTEADEVVEVASPNKEAANKDIEGEEEEKEKVETPVMKDA